MDLLENWCPTYLIERIKRNVVDKEIKDSLESEIECLQTKVVLLEIELETSQKKVELGEKMLNQMKASLRLSARNADIDSKVSIPLPPPLPSFYVSTNSKTPSQSINASKQSQSNVKKLTIEKKATGRFSITNKECSISRDR